MFGSDMVAEDGSVDRQKLGGVVFGDPEKRRALEAIIHPLVTAHRDRFLQEQRQKNTAMVVLDVPLLFETGGDANCDFVILCYADDQTQRSRGLARAGMTEDKWTAILASQMPMSEKRARADAVIETQHGMEPARQQLVAILEQLRAGPVENSRKRTGPNATGGAET
jgi:dephospho-CoA kinase